MTRTEVRDIIRLVRIKLPNVERARLRTALRGHLAVDADVIDWELDLIYGVEVGADG